MWGDIIVYLSIVFVEPDGKDLMRSIATCPLVTVNGLGEDMTVVPLYLNSIFKRYNLTKKNVFLNVELRLY